MKKSGKIFLSAVLLITVTVLFAGCFPETPLTREQKDWVRQLEKNYPDDTFTVVGHSIISLGVRSPACVSVESENFPGVDIQIYEYKGELYSNYPRYYHRDAVEEYFGDMITDYFDCDYVEIVESDTSDKPLKYMSDKKYIEKYALHHYFAYLYYEEGHDYPDEDEIVSMSLDYLEQIHVDGEKGNLISLEFCRPGADKNYKDMDMIYHISLHEGNTCIRNEKERYDLYRDVPLKDLLAST